MSSAKNSSDKTRKVNEELLGKLAHLARLEFTGDRSQEMLRDLNNMVDWVEKLKEVNVEGVEPLTSMSKEVNVWVEDVAQPPLDPEKALQNAPVRRGDFFSVPKVID